MKTVYKTLSVAFAVLFSFLYGKNAKAATSSKDVTSRINKIRSILIKNEKTVNTIELSGKDVSNQDLSDWANWANWSNWNNWNNWRNWNNWANWANWANY